MQPMKRQDEEQATALYHRGIAFAEERRVASEKLEGFAW